MAERHLSATVAAWRGGEQPRQGTLPGETTPRRAARPRGVAAGYAECSVHPIDTWREGYRYERRSR